MLLACRPLSLAVCSRPNGGRFAALRSGSVSAAAIGLGVALLAGCGSGAPTVEVVPQDLEERVGLTVRESLGVEPEVECHEALEGRVDADTTCTVHVGDRTVIAGVLVTKVDEDGTVFLDISLDEPVAQEPEEDAPAQDGGEETDGGDREGTSPEAPADSGDGAGTLPLTPEVTLPTTPAKER